MFYMGSVQWPPSAFAVVAYTSPPPLDKGGGLGFGASEGEEEGREAPKRVYLWQVGSGGIPPPPHSFQPELRKGGRKDRCGRRM